MENKDQKKQKIYSKNGDLVFDGENFYLSEELFCRRCHEKLRNGGSPFCFECQNEIKSQVSKKYRLKYD